MTGPERRRLYARADDLFRELEIMNLTSGAGGRGRSGEVAGLRLPPGIQAQAEQLAADLGTKKRVPVYSALAHSFLMDSLEVLMVDVEDEYRQPVPQVNQSMRGRTAGRPEMEHALSEVERVDAQRERAFDRWKLAHGCLQMLVRTKRPQDEIDAAARDRNDAWDAYIALAGAAAA